MTSTWGEKTLRGDIIEQMGYIEREVKKAMGDNLGRTTQAGLRTIEANILHLLQLKAGANKDSVEFRVALQDHTVNITAGNFYTAMLLVGIEVHPLATEWMSEDGTKYWLGKDGGLLVQLPIVPERVVVALEASRPTTPPCFLCGAATEEIEPTFPDPCSNDGDALVRCTECGVEYHTNERSASK